MGPDCSSSFSLKNNNIQSLQEAFLHRKFFGTTVLLGCNSFSFSVPKMRKNSRKKLSCQFSEELNVRAPEENCAFIWQPPDQRSPMIYLNIALSLSMTISYYRLSMVRELYKYFAIVKHYRDPTQKNVLWPKPSVAFWHHKQV